MPKLKKKLILMMVNFIHNPQNISILWISNANLEWFCLKNKKKCDEFIILTLKNTWTWANYSYSTQMIRTFNASYVSIPFATPSHRSYQTVLSIFHSQHFLNNNPHSRSDSFEHKKGWQLWLKMTLCATKPKIQSQPDTCWFSWYLKYKYFDRNDEFIYGYT